MEAHPAKHKEAAVAGRWEDKPKYLLILFLKTCHYQCQQMTPRENPVVVINELSKFFWFRLALLNDIWTHLNPQMSALKPQNTLKTAKKNYSHTKEQLWYKDEGRQNTAEGRESTFICIFYQEYREKTSSLKVILC